MERHSQRGAVDEARAPGCAQPDLCIAIVTYNSARYLERLEASLPKALPTRQVLVVVVDNSSTDGTVGLARAMGLYVIEAGGNLGYSAAINLARQWMPRGSDLLILNPDLVIGSVAVERLVEALGLEDVGIALPQLTDSRGNVFPHLRREPSLSGSFGDALVGGRWASRPRFLTDGLLRPDDYLTDRDVAWGGGAAVLVSAACNERVGEWAGDRYFLYAEETDYQRRARNAGFRVRYVHTAEVSHDGGGSGTSAQLLALMSVNRVRYFRSYHGPAASLVFRGVVAAGHVVRINDPAHRFAAAVVLNRKKWRTLPSATPTDLGTPCEGSSSQDCSRPARTLCLHGIGEPKRELERGEERFWITPETLENVLDAVVAQPTEVEVTVDDSNSSDVEYILPALESRGLKAKFFVITDRIGAPGSLSEEQVRLLHRRGMTIGTHGATHRPWRELSRAELDAELMESMARLTAITGERVRFAACPLGSYDRGVLAALRRFGLDRVYTVDEEASRPTAWTRSRYTLTRFDSTDTVAARLSSPRGSVLERAKYEVRTAAKRWR